MAAFLTGAILAVTDPVAVIAQLRILNAPEDLATLFEGESLFNDAAAVDTTWEWLGLLFNSQGSSNKLLVRKFF